MTKQLMTNEQLNELRAEYANIIGIDPCGESYRNLIKLLDSATDELLLQLYRAQIKFVSSLAFNRCNRRGLLD